MPSRSTIGFVKALALLVATAVHLCADVASDMPELSRLQSIPDLSVLRTTSGRFVVISSDSSSRLYLARWAEETAARLHRTLGLPLPLGRENAIHISVRECPAGEPARVATEAEFLRGRQMDRLVLWGYPDVDQEQAQAGLCRLLFRVYMEARAEAGQAAALVPAWLWEGGSQNLYTGLRSRNSELIQGIWQSGKLPSLAAILEDCGGEALPAESTRLYRAASGVIVGWLLSQPAGAECMDAVLRDAAAGRVADTTSLAAIFRDCGSAADVDAKWDAWILRQRRVVFEPGVASPAALSQLKRELLLCPGSSAIPFEEKRLQHRDFRGLIALRDAGWIGAFAVSKAQSLRLLAVGRGESFGLVVEAYCRFLKALGAGASPEALAARLSEAEDQLVVVERDVSAGYGEEGFGRRSAEKR